jgi:hypothetical protein
MNLKKLTVAAFLLGAIWSAGVSCHSRVKLNQLPFLSSIAIDSKDNIYIAQGTTIVKMDGKGHTVAAFGGLGEKEGKFSSKPGMLLDIAIGPEAMRGQSIGRIFISDPGNCRIQNFDENGELMCSWEGDFSGSLYVDVQEIDKVVYVYAVDTGAHRVHIFSNRVEGMKHEKTFGKEGNGEGEFNYPICPVIDRDGNLFVSDFRNRRIQKFDPMGNFLFSFSIEYPNKKKSGPQTMAIDNEGNLYVSVFDRDLTKKSGRILVYDKQGKLIRRFIGWYRFPIDLAVTPDGKLLVCMAFENKIVRYSLEGKYLGEFKTELTEGLKSKENKYRREARFGIWTALAMCILGIAGYFSYRVHERGETEVTEEVRSITWLLGIGCLIMLVLVTIVGVPVYWKFVRPFKVAREGLVAGISEGMNAYKQREDASPEAFALMENIREIVSSGDASFWGVAIGCGVIGVTLEDKRIETEEFSLIEEVDSLLRLCEGNLGMLEMGEFIKEHPEIEATMEELENTGKSKMSPSTLLQFFIMK